MSILLILSLISVGLVMISAVGWLCYKKLNNENKNIKTENSR